MQTFGQKAVGLSFNPSGDSAVDRIKSLFAQIIDEMNDYRNAPPAGPDGKATSAEAKRLASIAITEAQGAQMWAVKALTWRD
jgi:hypothetical protein